MASEWKAGDKAKWLGEQPVLEGITRNPPPPGWKPPSAEQMEFARKLGRNMHVTIDAASDGLPTRAVSSDGFVFDPSVDIECLVPADADGWLHPDPVLRGKRWGKR